MNLVIFLSFNLLAADLDVAADLRPPDRLVDLLVSGLLAQLLHNMPELHSRNGPRP
jgi:hypothetical protein